MLKFKINTAGKFLFSNRDAHKPAHLGYNNSLPKDSMLGRPSTTAILIACQYLRFQRKLMTWKKKTK